MTPLVDLSKPYIRVWLSALALHVALFSIFYGPPGTGVLFTVIGGGVIFALARMYHDTEALILFVAHTLYGYVFVGLLGLALSELYDTHVKRDSPLRPGNLLTFGIVGLLVGWLTARAKPTVAASGKWIWILPVPIFVYSFLHDWLWRCQFCPDAKTLYFYSSAGLDGLITWPAFSLTGYSLGAWIAGRMRVQPRPPALL